MAVLLEPSGAIWSARAMVANRPSQSPVADTTWAIQSLKKSHRAEDPLQAPGWSGRLERVVEPDDRPRSGRASSSHGTRGYGVAAADGSREFLVARAVSQLRLRAGFRRAGRFLAGPFARFSASRSQARSRVSPSTVSPDRSDALTSPSVT